MKKFPVPIVFPVAVIIFASYTKSFAPATAPVLSTFEDTVLYPDEKHFTNVRQLTVGGDNAEAYWSYDSKYLSTCHEQTLSSGFTG